MLGLMCIYLCSNVTKRKYTKTIGALKLLSLLLLLTALTDAVAAILPAIVNKLELSVYSCWPNVKSTPSLCNTIIFTWKRDGWNNPALSVHHDVSCND